MISHNLVDIIPKNILTEWKIVFRPIVQFSGFYKKISCSSSTSVAPVLILSIPSLRTRYNNVFRLCYFYNILFSFWVIVIYHFSDCSYTWVVPSNASGAFFVDRCKRISVKWGGVDKESSTGWAVHVLNKRSLFPPVTRLLDLSQVKTWSRHNLVDGLLAIRLRCPNSWWNYFPNTLSK